MPSNAQKGARSKLADVLADIKNSRIDDGSDCNQIRPTASKRRVAVNYVALSGHTPRQSRSSTSHASQQNNSESKANTSPSKAKSFVLKFVDYTVDLTNFLPSSKNDYREPSLYPIIRDWMRINNPPKEQDQNQHERSQQKQMNIPQQSPTNQQTPNETTTQEDSPRHNLSKILNKKPKFNQNKTKVDTICHNLMLSLENQHVNN